MAQLGINICVDARVSPRSCGSQHDEFLTALVSCAAVTAMTALAAVVGFTMRRWVAHGITIRTLPDATSFSLIFAGVLYFLRYALLANEGMNENSYDSSRARWWRFVERLPIITIISCYASVAVFLATIINNNPKHRNRPIGAIVFGILYGIGLIIIIIEAGVVTSPPVLSHAPYDARISSSFNNSGRYQLFVSCLLSLGLQVCATLLWRARQQVIAYAAKSQSLTGAKKAAALSVSSPNKIAPAGSSNAFGGGATISAGQRKFEALLDRLQHAVYVCIFAPPLAIALIVRDVAWFSLSPIAGGNTNWFTAHVAIHIVEVISVCCLVAMFCHLFEASTFTKDGWSFFQPKHTVQVRVAADGGTVVTFGGNAIASSAGGITVSSKSAPSGSSGGSKGAQQQDAPSKVGGQLSVTTAAVPSLSSPNPSRGGAQAWSTAAPSHTVEVTSSTAAALPPPSLGSPTTPNAPPTVALLSSSSNHDSSGVAISIPLTELKSDKFDGGSPLSPAAPGGAPVSPGGIAVTDNDETVYRARAAEQSIALQIARDMAQWWKDRRVRTEGWRYLFTFPMPSNDADMRLNALGVLCLVPAHLLLLRFYNTPVLGWWIFAGFVLRTSSGPRFDPQAHFVLWVIRPLLVERWRLWKSNWAPGHPRRFAQLCGIMFSSTAMILYYALPDDIRYSNWIWAVLYIATSLQCWFNLCMGCGMFWAAKSMRLLPAEWCEACLINFEEGNQ